LDTEHARELAPGGADLGGQADLVAPLPPNTDAKITRKALAWPG
jgi:hypothetical protein